jgi:preprotein translocase subunit SecG
LFLAQYMEAWLAALIVGAVVAIVGFIMLQSGKKKLDAGSFTPERTQESLRKDKEMVQRRTS